MFCWCWIRAGAVSMARTACDGWRISLSSMRPSDPIAVVTFAYNYQTELELSSDMRAVLRAGRGNSAIRYVYLMAGRPEARKAAVFVMDNPSPVDVHAEQLKKDVVQSEPVFNALLTPIKSGRVALRSRRVKGHSDGRMRQ